MSPSDVRWEQAEGIHLGMLSAAAIVGAWGQPSFSLATAPLSLLSLEQPSSDGLRSAVREGRAAAKGVTKGCEQSLFFLFSCL